MQKLKQQKVLLLGGHVLEYHDFASIAPLLSKMLQADGHSVYASEDWDMLVPEKVRDFDVIVLFITGGELSPEQEEGLLEAIQGKPWGITGHPKGLIALHGASTTKGASDRYNRLLGARFLSHPDMGAQITAQVTDSNHPIMQGVQDFALVDELYLQDWYPPFRTLLSTRYKEFDIPLAWIKDYGLGRVFYLAFGHGPDQLSHPMVQRMIRNAVFWADSSL